MNLPGSTADATRVEEFRRQHRTGVVTLVFTGMVGSTALKQQLGDRAAADLFRKHHELVRRTLRQFPQAEEFPSGKFSVSETF
jgi:class 3 adenylate cyclase